MPTLWLVKAGDENRQRDYSEFFLHYGVLCVDGEEARRNLNQVQQGDRVLLARGISQVIAAGVVVARDGRTAFEDTRGWSYSFDGWELPHHSFVEWHRSAQPISASGLAIGTFQRCHVPELQVLGEKLIAETPAVLAAPLPEVQRIEEEEIIGELIRRGLRTANAEETVSALRRIRRLSAYYSGCEWDGVLEDEVRSFLVLPLLLALGWSEQQIKLELSGIDVACFERPYQRWADRPRCQLLVEAKKFAFGISPALAQAAAYANKTFAECCTILSTNGHSYVLARRNAGEPFPDIPEPTAYLNLDFPLRKYPFGGRVVEGAMAVFQALMPRWAPESASK